MADREPFCWVEIDIDGCGLTFGTGDCSAVLGSGGCTRKCHHLLETCPVQDDFQRVVAWRTLRLCQPRAGLPRDGTWFPILDGDPSEISASVNIAGSDPDLSAFGRRATISVPLMDIPYHDRLLDPYQAERIDGTAQIDEGPYDPAARGTLLARLLARWPYFAGRALRRCDGYLAGGTVTGVVTRHYVITEFPPPGADWRTRIEGVDVLDLADDRRVVVPPASNGRLAAPIGDGMGETCTLAPEGVGDLRYRTSGRARIGSEIVSYTRSGDVLTLTARGLARTSPASHAAGDTVQEGLSFVNARVDEVAAQLFQAAGIDEEFLPLVDWEAEARRWLSGLRLTRDVYEPEGVKSLLSTLVPLGLSFAWEAETRTIRMKANRPVDSDQIHDLTDRGHILEIEVDAKDAKRASEVMFYTVQRDPTRGPGNKDNYLRVWAQTDGVSREARRHGGGRVLTFLCPWLETGNDAVVRVAAARLLARFKRTPILATITLDADTARPIRLMDVVRLTTGSRQDAVGRPMTALFQVVSRSEPRPGERVRIVVQSYQFEGRYAYATADDCPVYSAASPAQRARGFFACDPVTLRMPNGDEPYRAI